jgi:hypothetical protein
MAIMRSEIIGLVRQKLQEHNLKALAPTAASTPAERAAFIAARRAYKRDLSASIRALAFNGGS